jgi:2-haloacid dehalogenase
VLDLAAFDVLSFDCYGTLIDWESGLLAALAPLFAAHGAPFAPEPVLERFAAIEAELESGTFMEYRRVLAGVLDRLAARHGFSPTPPEIVRFSTSVGDWPAFPDTVEALGALATRYKLAIISNVDDDLFAASAIRLQVPFNWVITAQQVRSYKPCLDNFRRAIERIGVSPARHLHVAQSLYHDIGPARQLGLSTVWVNRRHGRQGSGATPPAEATPDLEVPDLRSLAEMAVPGGA